MKLSNSPFYQAYINVDGNKIKMTPTQEIYSPKEWLKVRRCRQRKFFEKALK